MHSRSKEACFALRVMHHVTNLRSWNNLVKWGIIECVDEPLTLFSLFLSSLDQLIDLYRNHQNFHPVIEPPTALKRHELSAGIGRRMTQALPSARGTHLEVALRPEQGPGWCV